MRAEGLSGCIVHSVHFPGRIRFLIKANDPGHRCLHPKRQLVGLNDTFQFAIHLSLLHVLLVQCLQEVQLLALVGGAHRRVLDVGHHLIANGYRCSLIGRGKKRRTIILRATRVSWIYRNKAGHVLIFGAQAVNAPGTHGWAHECETPGVHENARLRVRGAVGIHAVQDA